MRTRNEVLDVVRAAVACEVGIVQIREKMLTTKLLYELAADAAGITAGTTTRLLVNDRADVALGAGADGVHLRSDSATCQNVRESFGNEFLIGCSTHTLEEAEVARRAGADLITFGPVFESPGKGTPVGLGELKRVCEAMGEFPIAALGGIDAGNAQKAIDAGASGIAAIRLLNRAVLETGSDDAAACFNISV